MKSLSDLPEQQKTGLGAVLLFLGIGLTSLGEWLSHSAALANSSVKLFSVVLSMQFFHGFCIGIALVLMSVAIVIFTEVMVRRRTSQQPLS